MSKVIKRKGRQRQFPDFHMTIQRELGLYNVVKGPSICAVGLSYEEACSYVAKHRCPEDEFALNDTYTCHRKHSNNKADTSFDQPKLYDHEYSVVPFMIKKEY